MNRVIVGIAACFAGLLWAMLGATADEPKPMKVDPAMAKLQRAVELREAQLGVCKAKTERAVAIAKNAQQTVDLFARLRKTTDSSSLEMLQAEKMFAEAKGDEQVCRAEEKLAEVRLSHAKAKLAEGEQRAKSKSKRSLLLNKSLSHKGCFAQAALWRSIENAGKTALCETARFSEPPLMG